MATWPNRAPGPLAADTVLQQIRRERAVPLEVLNEAKKRRDLITTIALRHNAARKHFNSGSIAHETANSPLGDADCGLVLDRQKYPELGPDGRGVEPNDLMTEFEAWILPLVREEYPGATCKLTRRALLFTCNQPVEVSHEVIVDPTVDLVIALDRRDARGLWIPDRRSYSWDPSHPQRHTEMFRSTAQPLRVHRAHVLRLAKVAVKNDGDRKVMCSFNVEALGLALIQETKPISEALYVFLLEASRSIGAGLTQDPADVSGPISLPEGVSQGVASQRLSDMAERVSRAMAAETEAEARRLLSWLFGPEVDAIREHTSDDLAGSLNTAAMASVASILGTTREQKNQSSHGDHAS